MEIVRCSKGHFYDSEENATCPMCAAEAARNKNPIGNNVLPDGIIGTSYFDDGNTPERRQGAALSAHRERGLTGSPH